MVNWPESGTPSRKLARPYPAVAGVGTLGVGAPERKKAGGIIRPERVEVAEEHVIAGFYRVGALQPRKMRLQLGGSLGIHIVRSAIGTNSREVVDIESREKRIGGRA